MNNCKPQTLNKVLELRAKYKKQKEEASKLFGNSRCSSLLRQKISTNLLLEKNGWVLEFFNIRPKETSDYIIYRQKDLDNALSWESIPCIEFNCDNHTLKFNSWGFNTIIENIPLEINEMITEFQEKFKTNKVEVVSTKYLKLYIAVLDEIPDGIVPTLVAHSMLGAHLELNSNASSYPVLERYKSVVKEPLFNTLYMEWLKESFRKCVVRVNRKEFEKIKQLDKTYLGHENTTLGGEKSCAVVYPVWSDDVPKVLKFAKLWSPKCL